MERTEKEGIPQVAKDLDLAEALLYSWRAKRNQGGNSLENQKLQQAELARLKRENTRLSEEIPKKSGVLRKGIQVRYAMI